MKVFGSKQSLFMFDHETFPEWTGFNFYYLAIFKVGSHSTVKSALSGPHIKTLIY